MTRTGMRDVVFLLADNAMKEMLCGFLERSHFHQSLGCGPFDFDASQDVIPAGNDPLVYNMARELLRPFECSHQRAVIMVDADWDGSPGRQSREAVKLITEHISGRLAAVWKAFVVIVIDPELEAWVWQDKSSVARALTCPSDFRTILADSGHWPASARKPLDPKAAITHLRRVHRADPSNAAFRRLGASVSVKGCADPAFLLLRNTLRAWFPESPA